MKPFLNTRLLIPAIVFTAGIYYLTAPNIDPETKTFWKYLTSFAFILGTFRAWMLYKKKD
jgi:hypothetical protein